MAAVVTATAMPMQQQAMMATVPDGVAPGGQFMLQAPDGNQVLVTCPTENKAGDQVQFMVPMAAPMPQATATAMPAMQAMPMGAPAMQAQPMGAPMAMPMQMNAGVMTGGLPMYPGVSSHPAARGSSEMTQNATLSLPQPIKKTQWGNGKPTMPDKLQGSFHTGSPDAQYNFFAPNRDGVMSEADFDKATMLAGAIDAVDPFAPFLRGSAYPRLALDLDIAGRVAEVKDNMGNNALCYYFCCICVPVVGTCIVGCRAIGAGPALMCDYGDNAGAHMKVEPVASAHKLTLCEDCVVYERAAIRIIIEQGKRPSYLHFLKALTACDGVPLDRHQVSVCELLYGERYDGRISDRSPRTAPRLLLTPLLVLQVVGPLDGIQGRPR